MKISPPWWWRFCSPWWWFATQQTANTLCSSLTKKYSYSSTKKILILNVFWQMCVCLFVLNFWQHFVEFSTTTLNVKTLMLSTSVFKKKEKMFAVHDKPNCVWRKLLLF